VTIKERADACMSRIFSEARTTEEMRDHIEKALADAAMSERAAIVTWLCEHARHLDDGRPNRAIVLAAERVLKGEHRS
jgi:hypothetical protein